MKSLRMSLLRDISVVIFRKGIVVPIQHLSLFSLPRLPQVLAPEPVMTKAGHLPDPCSGQLVRGA